MRQCCECLPYSWLTMTLLMLEYSTMIRGRQQQQHNEYWIWVMIIQISWSEESRAIEVSVHSVRDRNWDNLVLKQNKNVFSLSHSLPESLTLSLFVYLALKENKKCCSLFLLPLSLLCLIFSVSLSLFLCLCLLPTDQPLDECRNGHWKDRQTNRELEEKYDITACMKLNYNSIKTSHSWRQIIEK